MIYVVLEGGEGQRVLGAPVRARNERVIRRVGATIAAADLASVPSNARVLVVPENVLLNVSLFEHLPDYEEAVLLAIVNSDVQLLWGPVERVREAFVMSDQRATTARIHALAETSAFPVGTAQLARKAAWTILHASAKSTDGFIARHFNRPLSRVFSYSLLAARLGPHEASFISLVIGLVTAYIVAQPGPIPLIIAGFLFQFASMFDGVDGEMARSTLRESQSGAKIDTAVDNITYLACLAGFVIGWIREGVEPVGFALAIMVLVAIPLTLLQVLQFVRRYAPNASFVFLDTCVRRAAEASSAWDLRFANHVFRALRRDLFSVIFMVVSLTGSRSAIVALIVVGLVVANYTLLAHRARLVTAARAA